MAIPSRLSKLLRLSTRSSGVILVAMILGKAASFFWKMLVLRLDVSLLGQIEVFLTTLGLATTFSTLALPAAVTRFALLTPTKHQTYWREGVRRSLPAFLVVTAVLFLLTRWGVLMSERATVILPIFLLLLILSIFQDFSLASLNAQKRFAAYGLGEYVLVPALKLGLLILILLGWLPPSLLFSQVIWALGAAALLISLLPFTRKPSLTPTAITVAEKNTFWSYSLFLSGSLLTFMLYNALDVYVLRYFFDSTMVGIYVGMLSLINLMDLSFLPFLHTLPARLSERKKAAGRRELTYDITQLLLVCGVVFGTAGTLLSAVLLPLISNYAAVVPISVIALFMLFKTIHSAFVLVYRHYLDFQGEQKFTAQTMGLALVLKAAACLLLVPPFGLAGLAAGNLVADVFHWWLLRDRVRSVK